MASTSAQGFALRVPMNREIPGRRRPTLRSEPAFGALLGGTRCFDDLAETMGRLDCDPRGECRDTVTCS